MLAHGGQHQRGSIYYQNNLRLTVELTVTYAMVLHQYISVDDTLVKNLKKIVDKELAFKLDISFLLIHFLPSSEIQGKCYTEKLS